MTDGSYNTIIIGGGFYGLRIALFLRETLGVRNILVIEKESEMMTHASYNNQARVHNGYHYPRSVLTALRSRVNFPTFVEEYGDAVVSDFPKYYAVAKKLSKVNAAQFQQFYEKIGADVTPAAPAVKKLFNPYLTDGVFLVKEYALNARSLRDLLLKRIAAYDDIELHTKEEVLAIRETAQGLEVDTSSGAYRSEHVINCGYSQINKINQAMGLPTAPFKHEITEMCLVELPPALKNFSVTMMDGPFFSIMPFPDRGLHTLSHVRYTPHITLNKDSQHFADPHTYFNSLKLRTNFSQMYADVVRYVPALKDIKHRDSLWEVKTVLLASEDSDSRPILFKPHFGLKNYTCIMGGKLDNIYDVFQELEKLYGEEG
jgi:glycine/D-amino acid oxidase-like deaminating enzyme